MLDLNKENTRVRNMTIIIFLIISSIILLCAYFLWEKPIVTEQKTEEKPVQMLETSTNTADNSPIPKRRGLATSRVEQNNYRCTNEKTGEVIYASNCPTSYTAEVIGTKPKAGIKPKKSKLPPKSGQGPTIAIIKDVQAEINQCNVKYNKLITETEKIDRCLWQDWCKERLDRHRKHKKLCIEDAKNSEISKNRYLYEF